MKKLFVTWLIICHAAILFARQMLPLSSPSETLKSEIIIGPQAVRILLSGQHGTIVEARTLQFGWEKNEMADSWQLKNVKHHEVRQSWKPLYGERSSVPDCYNEIQLCIQSAVNQKEVTLSVRLYDEGLAFRYTFDELDYWNATLTDEKTQFLLTKDCPTWVTGRAQGLYSQAWVSKQDSVADRPQVIQVDKQLFVAVGEAALVDYARMQLGRSVEGIGLQTRLSGPVNLHLAGYQSPWRYVMVADHPGRLVEQNYLLLNLNEPNRITDTHWIKPGRVIREVTLTTQGGLACVDFAAEHGIEYVEFDAGWYGPETNEKSDATTVTVDPKRSKGPLDLHKVIAYAKSKQIGIILYVNKRALHNQLDQILPLYKQWGVQGVKFGFVDVGDQYATAWLHQAIRKAAKYELMVDIHDEYRPTGYSRTYPNLISQEGIRGDEESPSLEQTIYTFYNRMIAGAGDYTNCYFSERVTDKMGGKAAQLAKLVTVYSPWQFIYWYDRPIESPLNAGGAGSVAPVISEDEITNFYTHIPVTWDETRFIEGEMGVYSVVARRSGKEWYLAVLNAGGTKEIQIHLDRLDIKFPIQATFYNQPSSKNNKKVAVRSVTLPVNKVCLPLKVYGNSGCVIHLTPIL